MPTDPQATPLRLIFAGTPDFAARHLQALLARPRHEVIAVYTQPDRPAKRGKKPQASAVKQLAASHDVPVYQPVSLRDEQVQAEMAALKADLLIVVAYGLILPAAILDIPRHGCVNVHASLLPRWRGAAPIERAIEAGDPESGVTIMQMDAGLDTGDMLHKVHCPLNPTDTAITLYEKLAAMGPPALLKVIDAIADGSVRAEPQDDTQATYAKKIDKEELRIDWHQRAAHIDGQIRAFVLRGPHTTLAGERLKITAAHPEPGLSGEPGTILRADKTGIAVACGEGALVLETVQLPGARALPVADVLNARADQFAPGTVLG